MSHRSVFPRFFFLLVGLAGSGRAAPAAALTPAQVLVVANRNARDSMDLAAYYMERRGIPRENLVELRVTDAETCSRAEYDAQIAEPIRRRLRDHPGGRIKALALLYGMPLRVLPPPPGPDREGKGSPPEAGAGGPEGDERNRVVKRLRALRGGEGTGTEDQEASVDSEIALVRVAAYDLRGWVPNPRCLGSHNQGFAARSEDVLLVSRLDGPSPAVVRRVIDDSLGAEREGLRGTACFDARWKEPGDGKVSNAYEVYDRSLHKAAAALRRKGMPVLEDGGEALFPEGSRLPAALYCGWYSLTRYVGAFAWQKGSVGYHIASGECATLKQAGSTVWCKRMLEEGVAATLGPVSEPYLQAFPLPDLFMDLLVEGRLTLAEVYMLTLPYLSWKMVLIGDPLYRPFSKK